MIRKPYSWEEVNEDFIPINDKTPRFQAHQLGLGYDPGMTLRLVCANAGKAGHDCQAHGPVVNAIPDIFIIERGGKEYSCRRHGHDYIRYIQRIK